MTPITIAVVLAAGAGTRFKGDTHKLLAELNGIAISQRAISAAIESGIGDVIVITGSCDVALPAPANVPHTVQVLVNPNWESGQSTSLAVAIQEAIARGADAIVVGLADQPMIEPDAWRRVASSSAPIAIATYAGERRNPVRLHSSVWPLIATSGDEGARSLSRQRPDLVQEVPCSGSPADIDTLKDLRTWQNKLSTSS